MKFCVTSGLIDGEPWVRLAAQDSDGREFMACISPASAVRLALILFEAAERAGELPPAVDVAS